MRSLARPTRLLVLLAILAMCLSVPSFAQKTKIVHLHDTSHQAQWGEWLRDAKARFEAENPDIEVEFLMHGRTGQIERMILLWGTGEHPDVSEVIPTAHYRFALEGMFQDINPWIEQDPDLSWDQFFPVAVEAATLIDGHANGGQRWMLPASLWVTGAATNDTHFMEAGLTPPSRMGYQWTWDEYTDAAKKLTVLDGEGAIARHGAGLETYPYWIHNAGGSIFDRLVDPTQATVNSTPVIRALDLIQDSLLHSRYAKRGAIIQDFAASRVSIYMHGGPNTTSFVRAAGVNWDWSYAPNPKDVRGGSENVTIGFGMSAQTENPEAVWKWIKFLVTDAAASHIAYTGRPVPWGPVAQNYQEHFVGATPYEQVWIELISHPDSYNRIVAADEVINTWNTYLRQVLDGRAAPAVAMEAAQQHLDAIIPGNRLSQ